MIDRMIARLPEAWRELVELVAAPIAWVPRLQQTLAGFFMDSPSGWSAAAKYVFLLFPALLGLVAIWCTALSIYTLPFRAGRGRLVSLFLLAWWDAARVVWMYWVGIVRFAGVAVGWILGLMRLALRLVVGLVRDAAAGPAWIAFSLLVLWCALETAVFAYTLQPRVSALVADLAGTDEITPFVGPVLYVLLLALVTGSFACLQALADAVRTRESRFLAQIILVELFTIFFEVTFLYRGLVDATIPWMAPDKISTLTTATFGWIGVRGLTWYLFGQYGAPPLLALIARQPLPSTDGQRGAGFTPAAASRPALDDFKRDMSWLHDKSDEVLELLALPVLHLLGAALNFAMILTASRPVFSLPFRNLKEVTDTRDLEATLHLRPRKQEGV
jgi:hypothetical protein